MVNDRTDGMQKTCALLEEELHGLAQPLSSLQCRLEIGLLLGDEVSVREALEEGLQELKRVLGAVSRMRTFLGLHSPARPSA